MAETSIEWTDAVWNPTTGCDRISPGCDNCYALTLAKRLKAMGQAKYQRDGDPRTSGPGFGLTVHPDTLDAPLHWRKPARVFVNSMSDLFHKDVPDEFIAQVFTTMARAPRHTFQVLTKRPQRMAQVVNRIAWRTPTTAERQAGDNGRRAYLWDDGDANQRHCDGPSVLPNVWLGTSIESDRYAFRADHLRNTPAAVRWLSLEPLLGPLPSLDLTGIDWAVVGGESGPGARPMHPGWARDIRDRCLDGTECPCVARGPQYSDLGPDLDGSPDHCDLCDDTGRRPIPFFFKQWGEWRADLTACDGPTRQPDIWLTTDGDIAIGRHAGELAGDWLGMYRLGKKAAGRQLDERTWDQMPEAATRG